MIIHQPEISLENGEVLVSARVKTRFRDPYLPDRLWFRFPEAYRDYISGHSDGFLSSMLLIAMHLGEDLEVRGTVSPRLAHNLERIQEAYCQMHPTLLKRVEVHYQQLEALSPDVGGRAVVAAGGRAMICTWYTW